MKVIRFTERGMEIGGILLLPRGEVKRVRERGGGCYSDLGFVCFLFFFHPQDQDFCLSSFRTVQESWNWFRSEFFPFKCDLIGLE